MKEPTNLIPAEPKKKVLSKTLTEHLKLTFHKTGWKKVTFRIRWGNDYNHVKCWLIRNLYFCYVHLGATSPPRICCHFRVNSLAFIICSKIVDNVSCDWIHDLSKL